MADIINLRQARKARARADKARQAEVNRARFGETKAERQARAQEEEWAARQLEGKKLDRAEEDSK